ncbi:MAG: glutaminase A [Pseudomonadota bacterium]
MSEYPVESLTDHQPSAPFDDHQPDGQEAMARSVYEAACEAGDGTLTRRGFEGILEECGILKDDRRIAETMAAFSQFSDLEPIQFETFVKIISPSNTTLINRALRGELVVPDFRAFREKLVTIYEITKGYRSGEVAQYIPQLARVDPEQYAMSVCTIDGQRFSIGDHTEDYCVQSTCKPVNYAIALETLGVGAVHSHVGREPSGRSFNELTLNNRGLPHNPMINAGAIMCASLIKPSATLADRFDYVMSVWRMLTGGSRCGFDNSVYLSEKATADRNFALAYFMREKGAFPDGVNITDVLDFYFQCCSITISASQMAVVAATFANAGVCPLSNHRIFQTESAMNTLSLMYSCGMYDFSGEYAFTVGLPAKSGVSGALYIVVPGVCGICIWSPRLDPLGNTVRGVEFSKLLVKSFPFHTYASLGEGAGEADPRQSESERKANNSFRLCSAAARGDVNEVRRLIAQGVNLNEPDYDGRTALHLAASDGRLAMARYLIRHGAGVDCADRWGNTPLDDARAAGHADIVDAITAHIEGRAQG